MQIKYQTKCMRNCIRIPIKIYFYGTLIEHYLLCICKCGPLEKADDFIDFDEQFSSQPYGNHIQKDRPANIYVSSQFDLCRRMP